MDSTRADQIDVSTARIESQHGDQSLDLRNLLLASLPVAMGVFTAATVVMGLNRWIPESTLSWVRALSGVSCWLYVGFGLGLGRWPGLANLAIATGFFLASVAWAGTAVGPLVALLSGHAGWSLVLAWISRRDPDASPTLWMGWSSFHATMVLLLLLS